MALSGMNFLSYLKHLNFVTRKCERGIPERCGRSFLSVEYLEKCSLFKYCILCGKPRDNLTRGSVLGKRRTGERETPARNLEEIYKHVHIFDIYASQWLRCILKLCYGRPKLENILWLFLNFKSSKS